MPISSVQWRNAPSASRTAHRVAGRRSRLPTATTSTTSAFGKSSAIPALSIQLRCLRAVLTRAIDPQTRLAGVPTVQAFRALRYDEAVAGPLDALVAPPYDVIDDDARRGYLARSPYNVVHLTLPDSRARRREALAAWRERGRAARRRPVALVGRAGLSPARTASSARARASPPSIEATPYAERQVLPARAHARGAEGGPPAAPARDAHPARADLPALRRRAAARAARRRAGHGRRGGRRAHARLAVAAGERSRARRAAADRRRPPPLRDRGRLPARSSRRRRTRFAILVSSRAPGLEIFPTHRLVQAVGDVPGDSVDRRRDGGVTLYRDGRYLRVDTDDELRPARRSSRSSPTASPTRRTRPSAIAAVDRGEADGRVPARAGHRRPGRRLRRARRDDAAEVDVLLPQAHLRPAPLPGSDERLARALPRGAATMSRRVLAELPGREEREPVVGAGRGRRRHDRDRRGRPSASIIDRLRTRDDLTIVSEEIGVSRRRPAARRRRPDRRLA